MNRYLRSEYLTPERWQAYQVQVHLVAGTGAKSVLEVGKGSGIVAFALQQMGITVRSFDLDASLKPDFCGDVRNIGDLVPALSVDCVIAAQVLEHIPWEDVPETLRGLAAVSRRYCLVSVPYSGITLRMGLRWGRHRFHDWFLGGRIPSPLRSRRSFEDGGEHRWELGVPPFSRRAFGRLLDAEFRVVSNVWHPSHHHMAFYLCEKRKTTDV